MKFGCVFPTAEIGSDPMAVRDFVETAEGLGYSHIVAYDHVLGADPADRSPELGGPYDETHPFHEPMVLFGYITAITSRIEMMTGVLVAPQRQGVLVAKQAAELAVLSGGRFRLGVGTGWNHVEYAALDTSFEQRGRVLDEQVQVWRALWGGELVSFDGEFHAFERVAMLPVPPAPVPVWFGGTGPAALRRAARVGDGFVFTSSSEQNQAACANLLGQLEANGRRDGFGIDVLIGFGEGPATWNARIEAWNALGADTLSLRTMSTSSALIGETATGFFNPQQHIDALEIFMREVGAG